MDSRLTHLVGQAAASPPCVRRELAAEPCAQALERRGCAQRLELLDRNRGSGHRSASACHSSISPNGPGSPLDLRLDQELRVQPELAVAPMQPQHPHPGHGLPGDLVRQPRPDVILEPALDRPRAVARVERLHHHTHSTTASVKRTNTLRSVRPRRATSFSSSRRAIEVAASVDSAENGTTRSIRLNSSGGKKLPHRHVDLVSRSPPLPRRTRPTAPPWPRGCSSSPPPCG